MQEETKEEYIARHRKENGIVDPIEALSEIPVKKARNLKEKLSTLFFIVLFVFFLWAVIMMFGMMKAN